MSLGIYSRQQEENIYIREQAKTWQRSGLITDDQYNVILEKTNTDINQTNIFFRSLFFIFTWLCIGALLGLFVWITKIRTEMAFSLTFGIAGIISYVAAEYTVLKYRFYRYGIEEALALSSMLLSCVGFNIAMTEIFFNGKWLTHDEIIIFCAFIAISACWLYLRFGFLYAIIISIIAACIIPFELLLTPVGERVDLLIILFLFLALNIFGDKSGKEDFKKERNAAIQAFLLTAIYVTVNLEILGVIGLIIGHTSNIHLHPKLFPPYIYWTSYVLTFIIPAIAIYRGIRDRKRLFLNMGLVMACVTLATNKSYLGWTRYTWDPAILGIVLVALSILVTRWLNHGENKARSGFTAGDILKPESHGIGMADVVAAITPLAAGMDAQQPPASQDKYFSGGSSGGGGASRKF